MRFSAYWQPIGRKLALLIVALIGVVVVTVSTLSYRTLERTLIAAASGRVVSVSRQIATAFGDANVRLQRDGIPVVHDTALHRALKDPSAANLAAAKRALRQQFVKGGELVLAEVWTKSGTLLVTSDTGAPSITPTPAPATSLFSAPIGPLVASTNAVLGEFRLPVTSAAGDTLGIVRMFTRLSSRESGALLRGLIGNDARLYVGSLDGGLWTDLTDRVEGPKVALRTDTAAVTTSSDKSEWLGALGRVPHVPWLVWVAVPRGSVVADARALLGRVAIIGFVIVIIGAFAARALSAHIVGPLKQVTSAAEAIAAGDYSRRVASVRGDEVGRMSSAFNAMATRIQEATHNLEQQQVELEAQQADLEASNQDLEASVAAEITAREAAEHASVRTNAILAGAIDCIITMDHTGKVVEFNPAAESTFGYAAAAAVGLPLYELIVPPSEREEHVLGVKHFLEDASGPVIGSRLEMRAMRSNSDEFPAELTITRLPVDGPALYTVFLRDVSEQKLLEAKLHQSQKMEAVGRLAGGVAHDFNNILTVILTYSDLILSGHSVDEALRQDIAQVRAAADRAAALTRQLLAFSRKQVLHPVLLDVNAIVSDVHTMLSRVIREDIRLEVRLGADVGAILVDRGQLEQVLMNLAVNSRDAMPEGGTLVMETASVQLDQRNDLQAGTGAGPHVMVSVSDTGSGMDAATRERIFEPFFTTKGPGQGTGLGLATVYGIVQQSGGSIYVYSEPGHGTTFKVYFPQFADSEQVVDPTEHAPVAAPHAARILVVEDDPAVRESTRMLLQHFGYVVTEAPDANTALALLRVAGAGIEVVLTDGVMPGISGVELAAVLAEERPNLPVILVSGYTEEAVSRSGALSKNVVFLEKPFSAAMLSRTVANALHFIPASVARLERPSGENSVVKVD